ncbi:VanZ family protein [Filobacillus milosensis]|uniref:VanZ family protein n=1 Tax=Filobacillus milosensis TaxID=94137 RepID=A0A4Y8IV11_9BACI|nr:VanZ family protein [Filobacillus milosensis]TFB22938.1 VanZ family protein [Filobacillus milosensis]
MKNLTRPFLYIVFGFYIIMLTQRVLFKYQINMMVERFGDFDLALHFSNFVPFDTIYFYLFEAEVHINTIISNLAGNIIGFIPFGILVPLVFNSFRNLKKTVLAAFCLSFTYECLQFLFVIGSFDVDDLILNTLGGLIGYLLVKTSIAKVNFFETL